MRDLVETLDKTAAFLAEHSESKRVYGSLALLLKEASIELQDLRNQVDTLKTERDELTASIALQKIGVDPGESSALEFFADDPGILSPGDKANALASPMDRLYALLMEEGGM
jgi:hypothetical protein